MNALQSGGTKDFSNVSGSMPSYAEGRPSNNKALLCALLLYRKRIKV
jgi:hypothetical protein